ncbi:protein kinase [bacterium AH-315-F03]|nr:protein kinase [bacterium AH-315-F03]
MIGEMIQQYKILEKIGAGGMGEVFLAQDTKLDRKVALKFLPEKFSADPEFKSRFEHEAKATAALNHPNIVTVYDFGEHEGSLFIAMEHVDGQSLQALIASGSLKLHDTLDIAKQIIEGLAAAHKAGVVHRDVKPANIMMTEDGRAKLLDFGLAKSQKATLETKVGATLGTVQYESPEQSRGESVDRRSDLFSLGVVIYEMATGALPFEGEYDAQIRYAISHEQAKPVSRYIPDSSDELQRIMDKLLDKDPELRYQSAIDVLSDFKRLAQPVSGTQENIRSVAVLPFRNMSADPEQEFFCDGIAEDIINDLTRVENLHVAARTSSFAFKGADIDIRDICTKLNVNSILEGSVRKSGNRLRVTAQLVNASDGYHVWSERFDRELDDVFAVQEEIAASVTAALKISLTGAQKGKITRRSTENVEAYEFYLKARYYSRHAGSERNHAVALYKQAIECDPDYALAYAGLSYLYTEAYMYYDSNQSNLKLSDRASARALELGPDLSEAHSARGYYLSQTKNYQLAEDEFKKALDLNPNSYDACYFYGRVCLVKENNKLALELFQKATEIDPTDYLSASMLHLCYLNIGDDDERAAPALKASLQKLRDHLETHPGDVRALQLAASQTAKFGSKAEALRYIATMHQLAANDTGVLYNSACAYSILGEANKSLELLGKALAQGQHLYDWAKTDSDFDSLRDDPRFIDLIAKKPKV